MKKADVAELVVMLSMAFPRPVMKDGTMRIYERMLLDLDRDLAHKACARLIASSKWLPTISEIRASAVELEMGACRTGGEAWGDVNDAVRRFGRYANPKLDDPLVAECVRLFGWLSLCDSTNDVADRARFIELYDQLAARGRLDLVAGAKLALPSAEQALRLRNAPLLNLNAFRAFSED